MRRMAGVSVLMVACSGSATTPQPAPPPTVPPHAATSVLEPGAIHDPTPPPPRATPAVVPAPAATPPPVRVSLVRLSTAEGEDGHGNTVPAVRPVAIDLETPNGWHGGALTTTLFVGGLHFHNLGYPSLTTMRFIVADAALLPASGEVALQYGVTRRVVAAALPTVTP